MKEYRMRKLILVALAAATAMPTFASAQTAELRHDRREVREEQRELRDAVRRGDRDDIRDERRDLREARREHREDWRDYRENHRDAFHRGRYVGPRGYAYRPVNVGYRFAPAYYGHRYTIANPARYRLPPAYGPQRWIRYGDDVVLVNIRTGRVIEVHRDFFW